MRYFPLPVCLTFVALCSIAVSTRADELFSYEAARMSARHDLEIAKTELRHYWLVEYPRQRRMLNAQIELTQAEIDDYKERLRGYRPFDRFSRGRPLNYAIQHTEMCLREAELRLRHLWAERNALVRFHSDTWRLLEMQAHEARVRVAELEAGELVIEEAAVNRGG
jgi:hypothetical protein